MRVTFAHYTIPSTTALATANTSSPPGSTVKVLSLAIANSSDRRKTLQGKLPIFLQESRARHIYEPLLLAAARIFVNNVFVFPCLAGPKGGPTLTRSVMSSYGDFHRSNQLW